MHLAPLLGEKALKWPSVLGALEFMSGFEALPDVISLNAAMSACEKAGQDLMALHLFRWDRAKHIGTLRSKVTSDQATLGEGRLKSSQQPKQTILMIYLGCPRKMFF